VPNPQQWVEAAAQGFYDKDGIWVGTLNALEDIEDEGQSGTPRERSKGKGKEGKGKGKGLSLDLGSNKSKDKSKGAGKKKDDRYERDYYKRTYYDVQQRGRYDYSRYGSGSGRSASAGYGGRIDDAGSKYQVDDNDDGESTARTARVTSSEPPPILRPPVAKVPKNAFFGFPIPRTSKEKHDYTTCATVLHQIRTDTMKIDKKIEKAENVVELQRAMQATMSSTGLAGAGLIAPSVASEASAVLPTLLGSAGAETSMFTAPPAVDDSDDKPTLYVSRAPFYKLGPGGVKPGGAAGGGVGGKGGPGGKGKMGKGKGGGKGETDDDKKSKTKPIGKDGLAPLQFDLHEHASWVKERDAWKKSMENAGAAWDAAKRAETEKKKKTDAFLPAAENSIIEKSSMGSWRKPGEFELHCFLTIGHSPTTEEDRNVEKSAEERAKFARALNQDEVVSMRQKGSIAMMDIRYSRALGLMVVVGSEAGYLRQNYLQVFRIPRRIDMRDAIYVRKPKPKKAAIGNGKGGGKAGEHHHHHHAHHHQHDQAKEKGGKDVINAYGKGDPKGKGKGKEGKKGGSGGSGSPTAKERGSSKSGSPKGSKSKSPGRSGSPKSPKNREGTHKDQPPPSETTSQMTSRPPSATSDYSEKSRPASRPASRKYEYSKTEESPLHKLDRHAKLERQKSGTTIVTEEESKIDAPTAEAVKSARKPKTPRVPSDVEDLDELDISIDSSVQDVEDVEKEGNHNAFDAVSNVDVVSNVDTVSNADAISNVDTTSTVTAMDLISNVDGLNDAEGNAENCNKEGAHTMPNDPSSPRRYSKDTASTVSDVISVGPSIVPTTPHAPPGAPPGMKRLGGIGITPTSRTGVPATPAGFREGTHQQGINPQATKEAREKREQDYKNAEKAGKIVNFKLHDDWDINLLQSRDEGWRQPPPGSGEKDKKGKKDSSSKEGPPANAVDKRRVPLTTIYETKEGGSKAVMPRFFWDPLQKVRELCFEEVPAFGINESYNRPNCFNAVNLSADCGRICVLDHEFNWRGYSLPCYIKHDQEGEQEIPELHLGMVVEPRHLKRQDGSSAGSSSSGDGKGKSDSKDSGKDSGKSNSSSSGDALIPGGKFAAIKSNLTVPINTCFFPELNLFGGNDATLVAMEDGSIVKMNHGIRANVLPGAFNFETPGVTKMPVRRLYSVVVTL
jgi:hypothetical protein